MASCNDYDARENKVMWLAVLSVACSSANNGTDQPVAAVDLPFRNAPLPRLGCIGWFPVRLRFERVHRDDPHRAGFRVVKDSSFEAFDSVVKRVDETVRVYPDVRRNVVAGQRRAFRRVLHRVADDVEPKQPRIDWRRNIGLKVRIRAEAMPSVIVILELLWMSFVVNEREIIQRDVVLRTQTRNP